MRVKLREVADYLDCELEHVSRWENGKVNFSQKRYEKFNSLLVLHNYNLLYKQQKKPATNIASLCSIIIVVSNLLLLPQLYYNTKCYLCQFLDITSDYLLFLSVKMTLRIFNNSYSIIYPNYSMDYTYHSVLVIHSPTSLHTSLSQLYFDVS